MATYREFYEQNKKARRKRGLRRILALLLVILIIFAAAGVISFLIGKMGKDEPEEIEELPTASEMAATHTEDVLAPLPNMEGSVGNVTEWNKLGPVEQTLDYTILSPDYRMIALPECGIVDTSYFDNATFVGDSLTQGLELYNTGLPNAHFCAYKGIGPNAIVNGAAVTRADGGSEIAMEALVASDPDYVYILLGTNTLISNGSENGFLAYYEKMLDMMKEQLDEDVKIYIQAIPPVRPQVCQTPRTAGLENNRLRSINSMLAQLAMEKGCYYVDLQECLGDEEGNLREDFAYGDGIHMNPDGYQAWTDYLARHTAYDDSNPYLYGSPYYISG